MKRDTLKLLAAVLLLLCVPFAAVAFDSSALPGPAGSPAFTSVGGTVTQPVVFTGDNASGTGTVRIRPSDEDTQLVLCEAGNNAATEVCSALQHYNSSTTVAATMMTVNGYLDSSSTLQRTNTAFGQAQLNLSTSSTAASNFVSMNVYGTGGAVAGNAALVATGAAASTFYTGTNGTVTNDFRGPITNGGSATCNGHNAGYVCFTDSVAMVDSSAMNFYLGGNSATGYAQTVYQDNSGTAKGGFGFANASYTDADIAGKIYFNSLSTLMQFGRTDDVASGTAAFAWMDNITNTGVLLADIDGAGRIRPLLYGSQTDCTDNAGAAACGAAPTGAVVLDDGSTTVVVSTTAVTANSTISVNFDPSLGTKLGITCNTTQTFPYVSARTAATSFTITSADPAGANKVCVSYSIIN